MVINVSVQYNGGFLPEIILLTLRDYTILIPCRVFVLTANVLIPPTNKHFDYSGRFLRGFFFKNYLGWRGQNIPLKNFVRCTI